MNERKVAFLGKLEEILNQRVVLILKMSSLSCQDIFCIREKLWDLGGNFNVVKNSLARIAVANSGLSFLSEHFSANIAFAYCERDVPEFLRRVFKFSRDYGKERLEVLAGKYDSSAFSRQLMDDFSKLPDESHVYLSLVGAINAVPISIVNSLNAPAGLVAGYCDSYGKGATVSTAD